MLQFQEAHLKQSKVMGKGRMAPTNELSWE